jgi:hypothetical protein
MNTLNALGFVLCGCGLMLVPTMAPGLFPADAFPTDSSNLWVEFMGWVNALTGGGYLIATRAAALARRILTWAPEPRRQVEAVTGVLLRPALHLHAEIKQLPARRRAA